MGAKAIAKELRAYMESKGKYRTSYGLKAFRGSFAVGKSIRVFGDTSIQFIPPTEKLSAMIEDLLKERPENGIEIKVVPTKNKWVMYVFDEHNQSKPITGGKL